MDKKSVAAVTDGLPSGHSRGTEIGERSRLVFLTSVTLAGALTIALFAAIGFATGNPALGRICAVASFLVSANFAFIRIARSYAAGSFLDCALIFAFFLYLAYSGGESGSGALWSMTYPLIALFLLGPAGGSAMALAYGAAVGVAIFTPSLNAAGFPVLYSARVMGTYFFIWVFGLISELIRRSTQARLVGANEDLRRVTEELVAEKKQTDDIMANVSEGIFLLSGDLTLASAYSKNLEKILETAALAGASFLDLLKSRLGRRELAATRDYFDLFRSPTVDDALLADINPLAEADLSFPRGDGQATKRLRFRFTRIAPSGAPFPVMGVAADVTDEYELKRRLAAEEAAHRKDLENLFRILNVEAATMHEFIADAEAELEAADELVVSPPSKEILEALYQSAHAIKGNAALLGLEELAGAVHRYEDAVRGLLDAAGSGRDLPASLPGLEEIRREFDGIKGLIETILRFQTEARASGRPDESLLRRSIEKCVQRESKRAGFPVEVDFSGFGRESIPDEYRKLVKDVLGQLIRNSFAHGFEDGPCRRSAGKAAAGRISLAAERDGSSLRIRYCDDGRGIDPERLRRAASGAAELAPRAGSMREDELIALIFAPGFSTAETATVGAGRGVGMAMAMSRITAAGGKLQVRSVPGERTEFRIELPVPDAAPPTE